MSQQFDEALHFIAQCDRIATRFPIRHVDEVAPRRVVSHDFVAGSTDSYDWTDFASSGLPDLLRPQAE